MRLGISSYSYVWSVGVPGYPPPARPLTAADLLEKASELEVSVVQIADNLPLDRLSAAERAAVAARARRLGIGVEVGTSGVRPDHLRTYLRLAEEFGSPILRTITDADGLEPTPDVVVAALRSVMPDFERSGVVLAVENHDRFRGATLARILDRVDSPCAGLCLDTANSIGCLEDLASLLGYLGDRVVNLHIKDYRISRPPHLKGFVVEGTPAGQGQLDIPWLLAELRTRQQDPSAILELWPPPEAAGEEEAWVAESLRYLRPLLRPDGTPDTDPAPGRARSPHAR